MLKERANILQKLMHNPKSTFNELWNNEGASNTFAYHLKKLEQNGYVKKTGRIYELTIEGKKYAAYVEGTTGEKNTPPLLVVVAVIFNKEQTHVLMMQRKKEPFYNCWGFIGGKMQFHQYILECAEQEILEETGLTCDLELKGLFSSKTYNNNKLTYNHQLFIVKGTNPQGELLKETREGKTQWIPIEEVQSREVFPNVVTTLQTAQSAQFRWVEADREQENDVFTGMHIRKNHLL